MTKTQKNIQPDERAFQTWFKNNFLDWHSQVHPGLSADPGLPDLLCLISDRVVPLELKIAAIEQEDEHQVIWSKEIRPSQIRWHTSLAVAGGFSALIIGVWAGTSWRVFAVNACLAKQWHESGFEVGPEAIEIDPDDLVNGLADFMFSELGE